MRAIGSFAVSWLGIIAIQLSCLSETPWWGEILLVIFGLIAIRQAAFSDFRNEGRF